MAIKADSNKSGLEDCFNELISNSSALYLDQQIPKLSSPPSALEFYRDYVSWNRPCLIEHAFDDWPALWLWSNGYLRKRMGDQMVTVAATPNGLADAVYDHKYFVLPEQRSMKFCEFIDHLEDWHAHNAQQCEWIKQSKKYQIVQTDNEQAAETKKVFEMKESESESGYSLCNQCLYCQQQNGCMKDEYSSLCGDIEMEVEFASTALNKKPDAVNFWMGESRSISSLHQDPFENLYCVISGTKEFSLYPPTDEWHLKKKPFQKAMYCFGDSGWNITYHPKWEQIAWIDSIQHDEQKRKCNLLKVTVEKGQMLYLPSLWFHEVRQNVDEFGRVIAVNYWYDMNYDLKYNLLNFMKSTIKHAKSIKREVQ